jgi:hypothetical protein
MLKHLNQIIHSILGFTISYISTESALPFTAHRLDDITLKPCISSRYHIKTMYIFKQVK